MSAATMPHLHRPMFSINRAAEYLQTDELEKETGQTVPLFAAVSLKELRANTLDPAEAAGHTAAVAIGGADHGDTLHLSVSDNGPGVASEMIRRILDFSTRTSDKAAYRSPTRGLQGNALKPVFGIPGALGGDPPVVIEASGVRHEIRLRLDPSGDVAVEHHRSERPTAAGTAVALTLPAWPQRLDPLNWARGFSLANPHTSISVRIGRFSLATNGGNVPDRAVEAKRVMKVGYVGNA